MPAPVALTPLAINTLLPSWLKVIPEGAELLVLTETFPLYDAVETSNPVDKSYSRIASVIRTSLCHLY